MLKLGQRMLTLLKKGCAIGLFFLTVCPHYLFAESLSRQEAELLGRLFHLNDEQSSIEDPIKHFMNYHLIDIMNKNNIALSSTLKVVFVNRPVMNAFATEGNFIFIFPSLIKSYANIEEILFILCHEIGHTQLHHVNQKVAYESNRASPHLLLASLGGFLLATPELSTIMMNYLLTENLRLSKKFSQKAELEADHFALSVMNNAGFDPHALTHSLRNLDASFREDHKHFQPFFSDFSTHPSVPKRILELQKQTDSLLTSKYSVDREKLHEDFFRLYACFYSPKDWPENNYHSVMLESYENRYNKEYWKGLWETEKSLSSLFHLFSLYRQEENKELLYEFLSTIEGDEIIKSIPEFRDAFYEKDFSQCSSSQFIRKYQRYLFSESLDTRPSLLKHLAQSYLKQGSDEMAYFALAKMYYLKGHYAEGLQVLKTHSSLKHSPHGILLQEKLEQMKKSLHNFS